MNSILQKRFVELDDNDNGSVVMLGRDTKALAITERDFVNKVEVPNHSVYIPVLTHDFYNFIICNLRKVLIECSNSSKYRRRM